MLSVGIVGYSMFHPIESGAIHALAFGRKTWMRGTSPGDMLALPRLVGNAQPLTFDVGQTDSDGRGCERPLRDGLVS